MAVLSWPVPRTFADFIAQQVAFRYALRDGLMLLLGWELVVVAAGASLNERGHEVGVALVVIAGVIAQITAAGLWTLVLRMRRNPIPLKRPWLGPGTPATPLDQPWARVILSVILLALVLYLWPEATADTRLVMGFSVGLTVGILASFDIPLVLRRRNRTRLLARVLEHHPRQAAAFHRESNRYEPPTHGPRGEGGRC